MKVKDLIKRLKDQDQEKEVMIQQGEEFDYVTINGVGNKDLVDMDHIERDEEINYVVIEY